MEIKNLTKSYGTNVVYDNFNLTIEEGKTTCILGASGSGKSTLLNIIAGLTPYTGSVPKLKVSYIFQTPRLVSNLTVRGNLRLICNDDERIDKLLTIAQIYDKADQYPIKLSGGQAQRVSICRAFLKPADIILMDEPFSSLDLKIKISMMNTFKSILSDNKTTVLFVTHDIDESLYLSNRILVLEGGRVIFDSPNPSQQAGYGADSDVRQNLLKVLLS
jgi:NitT/TauT family transport system ATP-binding protein